MTYISFPTMPRSLGIGRSARNVSFKADTRADWVGEVDVVLGGETEITLATFNAMRAANDGYNATIPPSGPPPPSPQEQALAAMRAFDFATLSDPAVRAAFESVRDAILGKRSRAT